MTRIHHLQVGTLALWERLDEEQREQRDRETVLSDLAEEKRGRGRPAVGKPLPVRFPDWRRRVLTADAAAAVVPDAELVRWLVGQAYSPLDRDAREAGVARTDLIRERMAQS